MFNLFGGSAEPEEKKNVYQREEKRIYCIDNSNSDTKNNKHDMNHLMKDMDTNELVISMSSTQLCKIYEDPSKVFAEIQKRAGNGDMTAVSFMNQLNVGKGKQGGNPTKTPKKTDKDLYEEDVIHLDDLATDSEFTDTESPEYKKQRGRSGSRGKKKVSVRSQSAGKKERESQRQKDMKLSQLKLTLEPHPNAVYANCFKESQKDCFRKIVRDTHTDINNGIENLRGSNGKNGLTELDFLRLAISAMNNSKSIARFAACARLIESYTEKHNNNFHGFDRECEVKLRKYINMYHDSVDKFAMGKDYATRITILGSERSHLFIDP